MRLVFAFLFCVSCTLLSAAEPSVETLEAIHAQPKMRDGKIYELSVQCDGYTDKEYRFIGELVHLRRLSISGKNLNDRQLEMLNVLSELESIMINGGELTDDGYLAFTKFTNLKTLSLFHPSRKQSTFTGAGLAHLKDLPSLRSLTFAGATAGDEALQAVSRVTQLESFREWHNTETQEGLGYLEKLANLKSIRLGQRLPSWGKNTPASFDNETLAVLAKMPSLELIELTEARLDYEGIVQLKQLPNLKKIKIHQVDIGEDDIEKLKTAMPNVEFDWQPLTDEQAKMLSSKLKL